jgi:hypothetical protein
MNYQIFELDKDKPTHLIYKVKNYQNNDNIIEPILELYKGKLFTCLIKFFTNKVKYGSKITEVSARSCSL